jgi:hypothetical protein
MTMTLLCPRGLEYHPPQSTLRVCCARGACLNRKEPSFTMTLLCPKGTCSELPSLESGENTVQKDYLSKDLMENGEIVKKLKCFEANIRIEMSRST